MERICHLTSVHKRYDVRIFEKECKSLAKQGFETILIVNDTLGDEENAGVHIISTGRSFKRRTARVRQSPKIFFEKAMAVNAAVYHFHDPELLPTASKLKKMGKKVIFDSHEFYAEQIKEKKYLPYIMRKLVAAAYSVYEDRVFKKIDAVIYPCTLRGGQLPRQDKAQRIVYINNVPKLEEFYDEYTGRSFDKEMKACYIGTLSYDRGVIHAMTAAHLAGMPLILAGNFSPANFRVEAEKLEEYGNVDYRGYVNRKQVLDIYRECSIGINTLLDRGQYLVADNLSTKIYEYMSMGMPVIMSGTPYNQALLQEYPFGIAVSPEETATIAAAMRYLRENPAIAAKMGQAGRKAVCERFHWGREEKKLIKLYQDLLKK